MPDVPAGAKKPQDHKSKASEVAEFDFAGEHYVVEKDALEDLNFVELMQDEKVYPAWRLALGDKDWARFKESVADKKTGRISKKVQEDFFETLGDAVDEANLS